MDTLQTAGLVGVVMALIEIIKALISVLARKQSVLTDEERDALFSIKVSLLVRGTEMDGKIDAMLKAIEKLERR